MTIIVLSKLLDFHIVFHDVLLYDKYFSLLQIKKITTELSI